MSFDPLIKALEENPALAEELGNAKSPRERDAILDAHGIEKPGPDSQFPVPAGGGGDPELPISISPVTVMRQGLGYMLRD